MSIFPSSYEVHNEQWLERRIKDCEVLILKDKNRILSFNIFKINGNYYEGLYLFNRLNCLGPLAILLSSFYEANKRGAKHGYAYLKDDDMLSKGLHQTLKFRPTDISMIGFEFEN